MQEPWQVAGWREFCFPPRSIGRQGMAGRDSDHRRLQAGSRCCGTTLGWNWTTT